MTLKVCPESLWDRLCHEDATCTFYQTPPWHRIAARHYQAESIPLLFHFENTEACLPLMKKRRWGRDVYFSPFGTYTALVCSRVLTMPELAVVGEELKHLNIHLVSSPFTKNVVTVGKSMPSKTQVIDLTALDPGNPVRDWERDARRRMRDAVKNNVSVRISESKSDWDRYYDLYQISLKRWGEKTTIAYPKTLFDEIQGILEGNSAMRLWVAEQNGEAGACALAFYHNRHAVLWHSATEKHGMTQILFLAVIQDALQRGFGCLDLGGSGGLAGVETFKKQFGAKTLSYESSLNRPGLVGFLAGWRDYIRP